jgi:hypothetical protein
MHQSKSPSQIGTPGHSGDGVLSPSNRLHATKPKGTPVAVRPGQARYPYLESLEALARVRTFGAMSPRIILCIASATSRCLLADLL